MSEYFTFYEADIIAEDLVSRCINNTISGRGCCEVIPYDYRTIDSDGFCGLGLSLHYDDAHIKVASSHDPRRVSYLHEVVLYDPRL